MSDKVPFSKKAIQSIENFERAALCTVKAAEKITSRVFLYLNYAHKSPLWRCGEFPLPQSFLVSA